MSVPELARAAEARSSTWRWPTTRSSWALDRRRQLDAPVRRPRASRGSDFQEQLMPAVPSSTGERARLKLALEGRFAPALAPGRSDVARASRSCRPLDLRATYYDTADLRLARHGVTLRYRTGEAEARAGPLKLPVGRTARETSVTSSTSRAPRAVAGRAALDLVHGARARREPLTAGGARSARAGVASLAARRRGAELAELVDDGCRCIEGRPGRRAASASSRSRRASMERSGAGAIAAC